jgi:esterase
MNTVDLAYEEFGDCSAPTVVIVHGFFASSRNWRKVANQLSAQYHVYTLDMRNHGLSPHHPIMDYPSLSGDLLRFLDEHELQSASFIGHSMGGKAAMWLALTHSTRINKLIVVDIAPKSYAHNFDLTIKALVDLPLDQILNRKQAEEMLTDGIPELHYRQFLLQNLILHNDAYRWRIDLTIFASTAANIALFPDTSGLKPYINQSLFMAGAKSDYVDQSTVRGLFPNAEINVIPDAGHWIHSEQPEVFIEEVEKFLQRES